MVSRLLVFLLTLLLGSTDPCRDEGIRRNDMAAVEIASVLEGRDLTVTRFADAVDVLGWQAGTLSLFTPDRDPVAAAIHTARKLHPLSLSITAGLASWRPFTAGLAGRRGEDRSGRWRARTALGSPFLPALLFSGRDAPREADRRARRPSAQDGGRR